MLDKCIDRVNNLKEWQVLLDRDERYFLTDAHGVDIHFISCAMFQYLHTDVTYSATIHDVHAEPLFCIGLHLYE